MGYAYGRLLARDLANMIENRMFGYHFEKTLANMTYEKMVERMNRVVIWPEGYLVEIQAMVRGMQDTLGGSLPTITHRSIQGGPKKIDAEMLALWFSLPDLLNVSGGCSGFAVWGDMSVDRQTRMAGNHDMAEAGQVQYILVRSPDDGIRTVSVGSIASFGIWRGINETGVGNTVQGSATPWGASDKQRSPASLVRRYVMEHVSAGPNMVAQVIQLYETHPIGESTNVLFAQPSTASAIPADQMAVVIETDTNGVTARLPSQNKSYETPFDSAIIATNHYLSREKPVSYKPAQWWLANQQNSIDRYQRVMNVLNERKISGLPDMQKVLQAASYQVNTQYSVYLELHSKTISMAVAHPNSPAPPYLTPVSFTWDELFAPIPK